jgi:hypothetical protein
MPWLIAMEVSISADTSLTQKGEERVNNINSMADNKILICRKLFFLFKDTIPLTGTIQKF